jgi:hypothetical protein
LGKVDKRHDGLDGWDRYKAAGIEVWDMAADAPLEFHKG